MLTARTLKLCCDQLEVEIDSEFLNKRKAIALGSSISGISGVPGASGPQASWVFAMAVGKQPGLNSTAITALNASLVIFGFSVDSVLKSEHYSGFPRDLDVVELWSGAGTVVAAGLSHGLGCLLLTKTVCLGKLRQKKILPASEAFRKPSATSCDSSLVRTFIRHLSALHLSSQAPATANCLVPVLGQPPV